MLSRFSRSAGSLLANASGAAKLVRNCAGGAAPKARGNEDYTEGQHREVGSQSAAVFAREDKYGAHNYHPMPVAISKAEGIG